MKRRDVLDFILILALSAAVGAGVALPFYFVEHEETTLPLYLLFSAGAGLTIGLVARYLFGLVFSRINSRPLFAFLAVAVVIGGGTLLWSWVIAPRISLLTLGVVAAAEICGLTVTFAFWRYTRKLNSRLDKTKKAFAEKGDSLS